MRNAHDPELLDTLVGLGKPFDDAVWRVTWSTRDPLQGGYGGGRWSVPNEFAALYTSCAENGALEEVYHHLSRAPVFFSATVRISRIAISLENVLDLSDPASISAVGISFEDFRFDGYARSREVGAAAYFLDYQAIRVPSARWDCLNVVVFPNKLGASERLNVEETRDVNWPAWREQRRPGNNRN